MSSPNFPTQRSLYELIGHRNENHSQREERRRHHPSLTRRKFSQRERRLHEDCAEICPREEKRRLQQSHCGYEPPAPDPKRFKPTPDDSKSCSSASTSQPMSQSDGPSQTTAHDSISRESLQSIASLNTQYAASSPSVKSKFDIINRTHPMYRFNPPPSTTNLRLANTIVVFWGWSRTSHTQNDHLDQLSGQSLIEENAINQGAHTILASDRQAFKVILSICGCPIGQEERWRKATISPQICNHVCRGGTGLKVLERAWEDWRRHADELRIPVPPIPNGATESIVTSLVLPEKDIMSSGSHQLVTPAWIKYVRQDRTRYNPDFVPFFEPSMCSQWLLLSRSDHRLRLLLIGFSDAQGNARTHTDVHLWKTGIETMGGSVRLPSQLPELPEIRNFNQFADESALYDRSLSIIKEWASRIELMPFDGKYDAAGEYKICSNADWPDIVVVFDPDESIPSYMRRSPSALAMERAVQLTILQSAGVPFVSVGWVEKCYRKGTLKGLEDHVIMSLDMKGWLKKVCKAVAPNLQSHASATDSTVAMEQRFTSIMHGLDAHCGATLLSQVLTGPLGFNHSTQHLSQLMVERSTLSSHKDSVGLAFSPTVFHYFPTLPYACLANFPLDPRPLIITPLSFAIDMVARLVGTELLMNLNIEQSVVTSCIDTMCSSLWRRLVNLVSAHVCQRETEMAENPLLETLATCVPGSTMRKVALGVATLLPTALHFAKNQEQWWVMHPAVAEVGSVSWTYIVKSDEIEGVASAIEAVCNVAFYITGYDTESYVKPSVVKQEAAAPAVIIRVLVEELRGMCTKIIREVLRLYDTPLEQLLPLTHLLRKMIGDGTTQTSSPVRPHPFSPGLTLSRLACLEELQTLVNDHNEIYQILCQQRTAPLPTNATDAVKQFVTALSKQFCLDLLNVITPQIGATDITGERWHVEGACDCLRALAEFPPPDVSTSQIDNKYYESLGAYDREDLMFFRSQSALPPLEFEIDFADRTSCKSLAERGLSQLSREIDYQLKNLTITMRHITTKPTKNVEGVQESGILRDELLRLG